MLDMPLLPYIMLNKCWFTQKRKTKKKKERKWKQKEAAKSGKQAKLET